VTRAKPKRDMPELSNFASFHCCNSWRGSGSSLGMPSVAEQLRQAREAQKMTLDQVADATKIKADHIRALEEGRYSIFSAPVYIRGFVRIYAALLKLNSSQILSDLDSELARTEKFRDDPALVEHPRTAVDVLMFQFSKLNWRAILAGLIALILVVVALWTYLNWQFRRPAGDPLKDLGPGMYKPLSPSRGEYLPLPTNTPRH
jgi:cytoskeletal protein RodZ